MAVQTVDIAYDGEMFSPFTGCAADSDEADDSVLFTFHGDAGAYGIVGKRMSLLAAAAGIVEVEDAAPEELLKNLSIPGAVAVRVDAGWNGVNYYCFAPPEA